MLGNITAAMQREISQVVAGKEVWDLGFGYSAKEPLLLKKLGASLVCAVDKTWRSTRPCRKTMQKQVLFFDMYFAEFLQQHLETEGSRVAFMKWPENGPLTGITPLLDKCDTIVYIGLNDPYTGCGNPTLWEYLAGREYLKEVKGKKNDLILYGRRIPRTDAPRCREEVAAWETYGLLKRSPGIPPEECPIPEAAGDGSSVKT